VSGINRRSGLIALTGSAVAEDQRGDVEFGLVPGARLREPVARVPQVTASESATPAAAAVLPVERYVAGLARKRMAAGVLFRDKAGRVLLVEPSYKPNWEIPGGAVEADESPWATATRELAEELGWHRPLGRLLVVDYVRPQDSRPEGVVFVFDGGVLEEADLVGMVFPDAEIVSAGFSMVAEARNKVKPLLADRLAAALEAVEQGVTVLCEQGRRIA
jgi:8-oxo-dGTP pyrophosphatase MutT (NUDIX family)